MLLGLSVYLLNFIVGKSKNSKLAQAWLTAHRSLLENNFSVVGKSHDPRLQCLLFHAAQDIQTFLNGLHSFGL